MNSADIGYMYAIYNTISTPEKHVGGVFNLTQLATVRRQ